MKSFDVGVIGSGLAGPAAAIELARQGKSVVLFEKSSHSHDKVCGEFLSPECSEKLASLGINLADLGAPLISNFRLHYRAKLLDRPLPKIARSLSRSVLDQKLMQICEDEGVVILKNQMVTELKHDGDLLHISTANSTRIKTKAAVIATGKHDFKPIGYRKSEDSKWIGYKIHLSLSEEVKNFLRRNIELFVFKAGYGGLVLVENGHANLAFVVRANIAKTIGVEWEKICAYLCSQSIPLCRYLEAAEPIFHKPLTISPLPYGFIRKTAPASNIFCVGDQLTVIPSLAGDGMAIALMSGQEAAHSIIAKGYDSALEFNSEMYQKLRPQIRTAYWIHQLFNSPRLLSTVMYATKLWPPAIDRAFTQTRLRA